MKECNTCDKELPESSFDKENDRIRHTCKTCRYAQTKERRKEVVLFNENKLEFIEKKECMKCAKTLERKEFNRRSCNKDGLSNVCKTCYKKSRIPTTASIAQPPLTPCLKVCNTCNMSKNISDFRKCAKSNDSHYHRCIACCKPREWTKEKQKLSEKRYCERNKEKIQAKWKKRAQQIQSIIKQRLSARIKCALRSESLHKSQKTYEYISCTYPFLKKWIEYQFDDRMSWDNIGLWHIDHVTPCAAFDLTKTEEANTCFNWQNIRPCWAEDNMKKSSHIIPEVIEKHKEMVNQYLINPLPTHPGDRDGGVK